MSKKISNRSFQKILLGILILILVQISCGVDSNDARVQPVIYDRINNYEQFMQQLSVLGEGTVPPPWITEPEKDPADGGTVTISGWGYTQTDLQSAQIPLIILYTLEPQGCNDQYKLAQEVARVESRTRDWKFENINIIPGQIYGAIIAVENEKKSEISNILVVAPDQFVPKVSLITQSNVPTIQIVQKAKITIGKKYIPATISGTARPSTCVGVFERAGAEVYPIGIADVKENGQWSVSDVPLHDGPNIFVLKSIGGQGLNSEYIEKITIFGESEMKLEWPFGSVASDGSYQPDYNSGKITSWYGKTDCHWFHTIPDCKTLPQIFHNGLDIQAANGTPVHPVAPGVVFKVGKGQNSNLLYVIIDHGPWGVGSMYLHLSEISVKENDVVTLSTVIGKVGNTGLSVGNGGYHLHLNLFGWGSNSKDSVKGWSARSLVNLTGLSRVNINPTGQQKFAGGLTGERLKDCASPVNYWIIPWDKLSIDWSEGGTTFNRLGNGSCK